MLGFDITWAAFNVIEVMSSPVFSHKVYPLRKLIVGFFQRIGYLAASQSFGEQTGIIMLATNLIKKVRYILPI